MAHDEFCTPFLFGVASSAAERQTQFLGQLPASVSNNASSPPNIFTPYRVCVCVEEVLANKQTFLHFASVFFQ